MRGASALLPIGAALLLSALIHAAILWLVPAPGTAPAAVSAAPLTPLPVRLIQEAPPVRVAAAPPAPNPAAATPPPRRRRRQLAQTPATAMPKRATAFDEPSDAPAGVPETEAETSAPAPAAAPSPLPSPPPSTGAGPDLLTPWLAAVSDRLAGHRRYPPRAVRLRLEGDVRLRLRVGSGGDLLGVEESPGSDGEAVLVDAALATARAAAPYPPPPSGAASFPVDVPLRFRLSR